MEWRDIDGYPYQVNERGEVRRASLLKAQLRRDGYLTVHVCSTARGARREGHLLVHRLVVTAFLGPIPEGYVVHHRDADRQNNHISNLACVPSRSHARAHGFGAKIASVPPLFVTEEEWRPIDDWPYEVSSHGDVRRASRVLSRTVVSSGHLLVTVVRTPVRNGPTERKLAQVHRLVAAAFIGPCPDDHVVHHKDGDPCNNHVSNLVYMPRGEHTGKLAEEQVREIRRLYATGNYTYLMLGRRFGVSEVTICRVVRETSWRHVT